MLYEWGLADGRNIAYTINIGQSATDPVSDSGGL